MPDVENHCQGSERLNSGELGMKSAYCGVHLGRKKRPAC